MAMYGDLRNSLENARGRYIRGKEACVSFLGEFKNQLAQYYECPRNAILWFPIGNKPVAPYDPDVALTFCEQGNCWYFGIALGLGGNPRCTLLVRLRATYSDALYVGLANEEKQFNVVEDMLGLLGRLFRAAKDQLDKSTQRPTTADYIRIGY